MLASKFCQLQHVLPHVGKSSALMSYVMQARQQITIQRATVFRTFANDARGSWTRTGRRRTLKEIAMQPAGDTAFKVGAGAVAGGAVFGLGALCFYGLGLSNKPGAIENSMIWPEYVKDRIKATYFYFGNSVIITAGSAAAVFRSPIMLNLVTKSSFLAIAASFAAMIGSGMVARSLPYKPGFGSKQVAWIVHSGVMGAFLAPMCFLGGPLLMRAAWLTAGIVGGLSTVAYCAPSDKFLNMTAPLGIGLGIVLASSLGSMFLPPTTMLGSGLHSISIYGGLLLFSAFLLYDTQRIIRAAEVYPQYAVQPFDPINASISIYLDTLNIFIRIATILAGSGGNSKRR